MRNDDDYLYFEADGSLSSGACVETLGTGECTISGDDTYNMGRIAAVQFLAKRADDVFAGKPDWLQRRRHVPLLLLRRDDIAELIGQLEGVAYVLGFGAAVRAEADQARARWEKAQRENRP